MIKVKKRSNYNHELNSIADAIRVLSIDAVQKANSGHPGMPMGMADVATVLFSRYLKYNPADPHWPDRDRFVLSNGHGSMLLYSMLYLTGYQDISLQDIVNFRQLSSKAAGHPEHGVLEGIEATTGPLGQGLANAVGMALAERCLNARFGDEVVNHKTYVFVGDGCLMEGISQEAITFAAHYNLSNLIVLFDDNSISIDGPTNLSTSENQSLRFKAAGWNVLEVDGHNINELDSAIGACQSSKTPCFISCKTTIGFGSPSKAGTSDAHGSALGEQEVEMVRKELNWHHAPFKIPENVFNFWKHASKRSQPEYNRWVANFNKSNKKDSFLSYINNSVDEGFIQDCLLKLKKDLWQQKPNQPTRKSCSIVLECLEKSINNFIGGSADLTPSVNTKTTTSKPISAESYGGNYIHYGIREHAMGAIMNGISLHKGFRPYGGTFLVFSDYMRPSIRLAALMELDVKYIFTHDSIGLGEDGPTHQPVEHLACLRSTPNLHVYRPADAVETLECWEGSLRHVKNPSALVLSRQNLPFITQSYSSESNSAKGAYVLKATNSKPCAILIASGSEVQVALQLQSMLQEAGYIVAVVSMPCVELFEKQTAEYKNYVLGESDIPKIVIEASNCQYIGRYAGTRGLFVGMESFGASAPGEQLFEHFGIVASKIFDKAIKVIEANYKQTTPESFYNNPNKQSDSDSAALETEKFSFHDL